LAIGFRINGFSYILCAFCILYTLWRFGVFSFLVYIGSRCYRYQYGFLIMVFFFLSGIIIAACIIALILESE
jgi:hypothetical protein